MGEIKKFSFATIWLCLCPLPPGPTGTVLRRAWSVVRCQRRATENCASRR